MEHYLYQMKKAIVRFAVLTLGLLATTGYLVAQTSNEYTDAETATLLADIEAHAYDIFVLSTDGGSYAMSDIDLSGDVVIMAKDGLASKPVISDPTNTGTYRAIFDVQTGQYKLTVKGVLFDGAATEPLIGVARVRSDNSSVTLVNCEMQNFTSSSGVIRCDNAGASVSLDSCFVHDCSSRLIYLYTATATYGDVYVTNTTFANSTGASAIYYRTLSGSTATGNDLVVDHCTFYNIPDGTTSVIEVGSTMSGTVSLTNSVFEQVAGTLQNIPLIDYCYLAGLATPVEGTNTFTTAPVFTDAASNDFSLSNSSDYVCGDGLTVGDLSWYTETSTPDNLYSVDELAQLISDISNSVYSEYILTTPGGLYDFPDDPDISVSTTIKGADDLETRPILSYTANTSSSFGILRVQGATEKVVLTLENLEFDCSNDLGNILRSDSETDLIIKNCYIHNNTNSNGVFRMDVGGGSVLMENTLVTDCKQRVICLYTPDAVYGPVSIVNSSFNNITGPVIYYRSSGTVAIGTDASVDHATFNNIGGSEGVFKFRNMQGTISVKNSIFSSVAGTIDPLFATPDYCYVNGFETVPTATNSIETAPVYFDAANNNLGLSNSSELTAGDMQILGDLTWYDDVYPPKVFAEMERSDDTHILLSFNEMVDATSAELSTNYSLSGTFGLTGNPVSAVLSGDAKSVSLEVADLSTISSGQTVIVTVTGVADVMGNVISDNNLGTYTYYDEVAPLITMAAQDVNNDAASVATAQSNETGKIYLVLDGLDQASLADFAKAVSAGQGAVASVETADADVSISVASLQAGVYYGYAVDSYDNISEKSTNAVTISDQAAPTVAVSAATITNAGSEAAIIVTTSECGTVYLVLGGEATGSVAELDAAVEATKGAKAAVAWGSSEGQVSLAGVTPGSYYAYAVDRAGNISAASTEFITVTQYVPRVRYYAEDEASILMVDIVNADDGDVFVLTTSGGQYEMAYWVNITAKVTIMADPDLEERPVISNYIEASTYQTFRLYGNGASLTLKGIEIDSKYNALYPVKYMVRFDSNIGNYAFSAEDCYFHGQLKETGTIIKGYGGTHADSLIFRNCIFEDMEAISLTGLSTENSPSWDKLEVTNCTFMNIPEVAVNIKDQPSVNKDYPVVLDHCTFYNVGEATQDVIFADSMRSVSLTNSIFATIASPQFYNVYGDETSQSLVDYFNLTDGTGPVSVGTGVVGTNNWTLDPQFADAASGDLTLGNQDLYTLGSDLLPLGDLRWADVLGPQVLPEVKAYSDSTLMIQFSEWIDTTTALLPENYTLSGSAGLSGTAKKVELRNFRSVVITTESFMEQVGNEVVITVSGVQDLNGNVVDPTANQASYTVEEMLPVVIANEQSATNADGQFVTVQASLPSGYVYIILDGVAQSTVSELNTAVANLQAARESVTASYTDVAISTYAIEPGTYYAYFVDGTGMISDKGTNPITITDGIAPLVTAAIQSATNGSGSVVYVQSNEDNGKVYIILDGEAQTTTADFITAVALKKGATASVTAADTDVAISTNGLATGIYYAYAIDAAGNISAKGENPINITPATGIDPFEESVINIYSIYRKVVVDAGSSNIQSVALFDLTGKNIALCSVNSGRFESDDLNTGLYIVRVQSNNEYTFRKVLIK